MYVAEIKSLSVGFFRIETVGATKQVPTLITATRIIIVVGANVFRKHRIGLEGIARSTIAIERLALRPSFAVPILIVRREARIPFESRPGICLEARVVANTVVQPLIGKGMYDKSIDIARLEGRNLKAVHSPCSERCRRRGFRKERQSQSLIVVIVYARGPGRNDRVVAASCKHEENKKRCRKQNASAPLIF